MAAVAVCLSLPFFFFLVNLSFRLVFGLIYNFSGNETRQDLVLCHGGHLSEQGLPLGTVFFFFFQILLCFSSFLEFLWTGGAPRSVPSPHPQCPFHTFLIAFWPCPFEVIAYLLFQQTNLSSVLSFFKDHRWAFSFPKSLLASFHNYLF